MRSSLRDFGRALILGLLLPLLSCGGEDLVSPTTGSIAITATTAGPEPDQDGYAISVNDGAEVGMGANGTHEVNGLPAGSHTVRLGGMAGNCTVEGDNPRAVSVEGGATATVQFNVTCGPTTGSMRITATTSGGSPDPDGYTIILDGADRGALAVTGELTIDGLTAGDHAVGLSGIAANCQAAGENPRSISVVAGGAVTAAFVLTCTTPPAVSGTIRVTTTTSGASPDPDGYAFSVDGGAGQPIGASASATVAGVAASDHTVTLSGLASNCTVQGTNPLAVTVTVGATAEVGFAITCSATTGSIEITTATTGGSQDPDGYTVTVDNGTARAIGINETLTVSDVAPGRHQVTLAGMASNCIAGGENPRSVSVTAGAKSTVKFDISCPTPLSASKIAFLSARHNPAESRYDLYVMNPDGTGLQRLTTEDDILHFDWSPDGNRIAFENVADGDIHVIGADGSGRINLTRSAGVEEHQPDWSPDGSGISFWVDGDIHVMNSAGSERRKVADGGADGWAWSPDGTQLAFLRERDIYRVNVDGGGEINLTNTPQDHKQTAPSWSPDGRWISYLATPFGETWPELYAVNSAGTTQRRLTNDPGGEGDHFWSPDSRRIAYNTDRDRGDRRDSQEIYVMNADGTGHTNLTNTPGQDPAPSENSEHLKGWSPNGAKIVYERMGGVWIMNSDGSGQTNLNQVGKQSAWSPE